MTATSVLERGFVIGLCALAVACAGGQSSDDGAPRDAGFVPPDGGELDAGPDAGPPGAEIIVGIVPDGDVIVGCAAELSPAANPIEAVRDARQRCEGWQGWFECSCAGEAKLSHAYSCSVALFQACGVAPELLDGSGRIASVPTACEAFARPPYGRCELDAEQQGEYTCGCAPPLAEPQLALQLPAPDEQTHASCEQAIFAACTDGCSDAFGACDPSTDGTINAYDCTCTTHGLPRVVEERSCEQALERACSSSGAIWPDCTGYGGFCESVVPLSASPLRCTCADGDVHEVDLVLPDDQPAPRACRDALEASCGFGTPPEGALCMVEGNGYVARCSRAPSESAEHVCECYAEGSFETVYGGLGGEPCDESGLRAVCPEIAPVTDDARMIACEHFERCGSRITDFTIERCMENAEDACVACVSGGLSRAVIGADGCPEERVSCNEPCAGIVPKVDAVAACELRAAEHDAVSAETECLCERCYPAFGDCLADAACTEIVLCAIETGCRGTACESDPTCGPVIAGYLGTQMHSIALSLAVGACESRDPCAALAD